MEHRSDKAIRKRNILVAGAIAFALAACLLLAGMMLGGREGGATVSTMPGMTTEEIQAELDRQVAESMMTVAVSPVVVLEDDGSLSLHVINSEDNDMDQRFTVVQGGDVLYESARIAPGTQIDSCDAKGAEPGEASVEVQGVDPATGADKGSPAAVQVQIVEADKVAS